MPVFQLPCIVWSWTYTGDTSWKIELVGDAINLTTWRFLKEFLMSKLQNNQSTKLTKSYIVCFYLRLLLVKVPTPCLYHMWKFTFSLSEPSIWKKNYTYEALKSKAVWTNWTIWAIKHLEQSTSKKVYQVSKC